MRARLAESEARFRAIIDATADGILIVDQEGRARFINPAAERLFGRPAAELLGQDFGFAILTGDTAEIDIVRRLGGDEIVAELRSSETTWDGEPAQIVTLRDVTDRKRAAERAERLVFEQAAREQAEEATRRSQFLVEAGTTLDSSLDPDTTLQSLASLIVPRIADWCVIDLLEHDTVRRAAAVHSDDGMQPVLHALRDQYPPRIDGPQPSARVLATGQAELHRAVDEDAIRSLTLDTEHANMLTKLGVHSYMTVPLRARDGTIGTITMVCGERDFSPADLDLAEEVGTRAGRALENARLYEDAVAANKAKGDFLAVMSHELRTPLNAILGYSQLLLEGITGEIEPAQRRQIERVHASAEHLLQIIEEILTFASMESGSARVEPRAVQLRDIVDDVVAMAEPLAAEKGLDFRHDIPDPDAAVVTDPLKVRQIVLNLLTNAVKFTDEGSVSLRAVMDDGMLVIDVADTGVGIDAENLHVIFEPFHQVEGPLTRHAGGTGLGLTVSKRLANLLGGDITVVTEIGNGSTFTVRLPAARRASESSGNGAGAPHHEQDPGPE